MLTAVAAGSAGQKRAKVAPKPMAVNGVPLGTPEPPPVRVLVSKARRGHDVLYRYRVVNGSPFRITSVVIGDDYYRNQPELRIWGGEDDALTDTTSPPGWHFEAIPTEEDSIGSIAWEINDSTTAILGVSELAGFSIARPAEEAAYENGHWAAYLNSARQSSYAGRLAVDRGTASSAKLLANTGVTLEPNPAHGSVAISFTKTGDGLAVEVFDANGGLVKYLAMPRAKPGKRRVVWDGTDSAGAAVPPGTYLVRVDTGTIERSARLIWMR